MFSCGFWRPGIIALYPGSDVKSHLISLKLTPSERRIDTYGEVSCNYCYKICISGVFNSISTKPKPIRELFS